MILSFIIGTCLFLLLVTGGVVWWKQQKRGRKSSPEDIWLRLRHEDGQAGFFFSMLSAGEKAIETMQIASEVPQCWKDLQ